MPLGIDPHAREGEAARKRPTVDWLSIPKALASRLRTTGVPWRLAGLASCWSLIGAAAAGWLFVLSTAPPGQAGVADPFAGPPDPPAWTGISPGAGFLIDFTGALAFLPWLLMSIPVLVLGLRRLSQVARSAIWWQVAWTGVVGAGVALAVLAVISFHFPPPYVSWAPVLSWGDLAIALAFLVLGIIMWCLMMRRAQRPQGTSNAHQSV